MAFNPLKNKTTEQITSSQTNNNTGTVVQTGNTTTHTKTNDILNNRQEIDVHFEDSGEPISLDDINSSIADAVSDINNSYYDYQPDYSDMRDNAVSNNTNTTASNKNNSQEENTRVVNRPSEYIEDPATTEPAITADMSYEGEKISDLQQTGLNTEKLNTENLSNKPEQENKQQFNVALLKNLSLPYVLERLGAKKVKDNLYSLYQSEISIKEDKWYNKTLKMGYVGAISLAKHLISINDNIHNVNNLTSQIISDYEKKHTKSLFVKACKQLNDLQNSQPDIAEKVVEHISTPVTNENKTKRVQRTPEEHKAYWKELTEQLNNISLNEVMEHIGANPNEDGQRGKWKVWATGDNIQITGQLWKSWKAGGGRGAISLLAYHLATVNHMDTRQEEQKKLARTMAIKELIKAFGDGDLSMLSSNSPEMVFKVPFAMPHIIDFKLDNVRRYLNEKRGLPMWVIDKQVKAGLLFAGFPSDWPNQPKTLKNPDKLTDDNVWATFLSGNGTAAEMRAIERTDNLAKLLAKGSDKELGGFVIKAEKKEDGTTDRTVSALEAAIDSMSYHSIYPNRIATSCMGVTYKLAVKAAVEAFSRDYNFQLAFDNDQAGNEAAISFRDELIVEIGEEEYKKVLENGKLGYFDLGLRCLEESVQQNKTFYLDVQDNEVGFEVVKLFQDRAMNRFGRDYVKQLIAEQKIKYLNVCPAFETMIDAEKEAKNAFTKLSSGKPYYLRLKSDEGKPELKKKKEAFLSAFKEMAGSEYDNWVRNGLIISKKEAVAKDWNEYLNYLKDHKPEFKDSLSEQEKKFTHYSQEVKEQEKDSKKRKYK